MDKIIQHPNSDPTVRMQKVMQGDMLRKRVYDRVKPLIEEYLLTYHCEPSWVRVSYDLVQPLGMDLLFSPERTICGLKWMVDNHHAARVEVGSSVEDDRA